MKILKSSIVNYQNFLFLTNQELPLHQQVLLDHYQIHHHFSRPDSMQNEVSIYRSRLRMGQNLAQRWKENHPDSTPDIVIPAPSTANTAALSFAHEIGVRYSEGLYKNPFIGRTFIMPGQEARKKSVRYKLVPQEFEIRNKDVLIVDDSIVRGNTSREIVRMVREFGARKVYFISACPPVKFPCFYGVDMPTKSELAASSRSLEERSEERRVGKECRSRWSPYH